MSARASLLLALLATAAAGCASPPDPRGSWVRHSDPFSCDWEGGPNQGTMTFAPDGTFTEHLQFSHAPQPGFSTSAKGRWRIVGETLTIELETLTGRREVAPADERVQLLFQTAQQRGALRLTLTTIVHNDRNEPLLVMDVPAAERCTAVYERAS